MALRNYVGAFGHVVLDHLLTVPRLPRPDTSVAILDQKRYGGCPAGNAARAAALPQPHVCPGTSTVPRPTCCRQRTEGNPETPRPAVTAPYCGSAAVGLRPAVPVSPDEPVDRDLQRDRAQQHARRNRDVPGPYYGLTVRCGKIGL